MSAHAPARVHNLPQNGSGTGASIPETLDSLSITERAKALVKDVRENRLLPNWTGPVLLAASLAVMGFMYHKIEQQGDTLIRIEQRMEDKDTEHQKDLNRAIDKAELAELKAQHATEKLATTIGFLAGKDQKLIERLSQ